MNTEKYIESRISIAIGKLIMRDDMIYQYYETIRARRTGIYIIETTIEDVLNQVEQTKADIGIVTINNTQRAAFHKLTELKELEMHEINSLLLNHCDVYQKLIWIKRKREILSPQAEDFLKLFMECYAY